MGDAPGGAEQGEAVLAEAGQAFRAALGRRLVAAYALGSLAHGGFSALVSDVDLGLALDDPLRPADDGTVQAVADTAKEGATPLHRRLSVFWGTPSTLNGRVEGGRFPPLDRLDLLEHNALVEAAAKVGLPAWPLARLEVKSDEEVDLELSRPSFPQLVGVTEVARLLDVTRQRASILAQGAEFPAPVAVLAAGPVWTLPSVRRFTEAWARRAGRPKKAAGGGADLAAARPRIASAVARPAPIKAAAKAASAGTRRAKKAAPPER
jgi:hypothetical protein